MTIEQKVKSILNAYANPKSKEMSQKELVRLVLSAIKNKKYVVKA
jgi:hypothetical protein